MYDFHRAFSMLEHGLMVQILQTTADVRIETDGLVFAPNNFCLRRCVNKIICDNRDEFDRMLERRIQDSIKLLSIDSEIATFYTYPDKPR
jgi:hypothetical protein